MCGKIAVNNRLEIMDLETRQRFKSIVQEIHPKYIGVAIPISQEGQRMSAAGTEVEVLCIGEKYNYRFYSKIIGKKHDRIPLVLLGVPEFIERYERRDYVRVKNSFPIQYRKLQHGEEKIRASELAMDASLQSGFCADISGGGMKIVLPVSLKLGEYLLIIPEHPEIRFALKGKVVNQESKKSPRGVVFHIGIAFIDLSEKEREKIIAYVFKRLRQERALFGK
jgi:c-di-GMP-binding flagellar brake protein YcgR